MKKIRAINLKRTSLKMLIAFYFSEKNVRII